MEFSRCPPLCKYEQPRMNIDKEDLDSLQLPHLEDVAQDLFAQLNHKEWDHNKHFIHWIKHLLQLYPQHTTKQKQTQRTAVPNG
jgi:hypothetical protein